MIIWHRSWWLGFFLAVVGAAAVHAAPKRVLILHSFGRDFAPFDTMSSTFRTELARQSPEPVEFYEASIETARFSAVGNDDQLLDYLKTLFAGRPLDLIFTVVEPATFFCVRHRAEFFPDTPLLAHVDHRQIPVVLAATNATINPVYIKIPVLAENILRVLPNTTNIVMVLGASPFERVWTDLCRREFAGFTNRGFTVVGVLDVDPAKVGRPLGSLTVRHQDDLAELVAREGVAIGIVAVPPVAAQEAADRLVEVGITSILNFAPTVLDVPDHVQVRDVDLAVELQILAFHEDPSRRVGPTRTAG